MVNVSVHTTLILVIVNSQVGTAIGLQLALSGEVSRCQQVV